MKRVFLFVATNLAILIVLGIVLSILMPVLGLDSASNSGLLFICAVFGMGGSFISLLMSKMIAKRSVGAYVIEQPRNQEENWLVDTVRRQAEMAGIGMPEVAIYDSPEINAFATGANRNNALVAVSTGLLRNMSADEAEAVLGHEVSHVANGDMVTLTLIQGVLNTFVYFFARVVANIVNRGNNSVFVYFMTVMAFQAIFGILASIIVMGFSRYREYRADSGGANLAGRQKMIAALQRLKSNHSESQLDGQLTAFGITGKRAWAELFMSHPPIEKRIAALQDQHG
ncbi:MAG: protease HtpX [Gammaproteobacteria bacterium]|nr:protease HtpX [Gammaproteobacteria bacterium]MDD9896219.1 protease HtpX [Gammaproteobacteria bacterium]MDD9957355.1 protease HtpX [Gammaproteobacteria bacterium]